MTYQRVNWPSGAAGREELGDGGMEKKVRHLGGQYVSLLRCYIHRVGGGWEGGGDISFHLRSWLRTSSRLGFLPERSFICTEVQGRVISFVLSQNSSPETSSKQPFFIPVLSHQLLPGALTSVISQLAWAYQFGWSKALYLPRFPDMLLQQWALTSSHSFLNVHERNNSA